MFASITCRALESPRKHALQPRVLKGPLSACHYINIQRDVKLVISPLRSSLAACYHTRLCARQSGYHCTFDDSSNNAHRFSLRRGAQSHTFHTATLRQSKLSEEFGDKSTVNGINTPHLDDIHSCTTAPDKSTTTMEDKNTSNVIHIDGCNETTPELPAEKTTIPSELEDTNAIKPKRGKKPKKEKRPKWEDSVMVMEVNEVDIDEQFVKGNGPGGQKINKTNSQVVLKHIPTGIVIHCQVGRSQAQNRKEARRLLALKVTQHMYGIDPKAQKKMDKLKKRKADKLYKQNRKKRLNAEAAQDSGKMPPTDNG